MTSVADMAVATISQAQRRVEVVAQNLANVTTPGYKRRLTFATLVRTDNANESALPVVSTAIDFRPGKIVQTGKPSDFALSGPGYFALQSDKGTIYSRQGQLSIDRDGRLVNTEGFALQMVNGNDLIVKASAFEVKSDGTVTEQGNVLGRIAVFVPADAGKMEPASGGFRAGTADLAAAEDAVVRQGAIEASNVSSGDEMVVMMESLRRAEAGQRMMNVYDDLMGRVITTFGDNVR
jgi:flagellar basal-body rod protein FlgF